MTIEEAMKVLIDHGFVHKAWWTLDEVWMQVWRYFYEKGIIAEFVNSRFPPDLGYISIEFVGSPDFLVELAEFLEGRK